MGPGLLGPFARQLVAATKWVVAMPMVAAQINTLKAHCQLKMLMLMRMIKATGGAKMQNWPGPAVINRCRPCACQ